MMKKVAHCTLNTHCIFNLIYAQAKKWERSKYISSLCGEKYARVA